VIFVVNGLESERDRLEESQQIVNWAFRQFVERTVARPGVRVAEAQVWMGEAQGVGLVPAEETVVLVPAISQDGLEARVEYQGPLEAPIVRGQPLAELVITHPEMETRRLPLVAESDVPRGGFLVRLRASAEVLLNRAIEAGTDAAGS
jgi:serine-type D-Ala-D-Ala carboxypeptidase (penicillin-binding protein 5/6)